MSGRLQCEVVCVFLDATRDQWSAQTILHEPSIEEQGGTGFVCGTMMSADVNHWTHGRTCRIPLARVVAMIEFETLDEYNAWMQHYARPPA